MSTVVLTVITERAINHLMGKINSIFMYTFNMMINLHNNGTYKFSFNMRY
jgi:hypothetical protein